MNAANSSDRLSIKSLAFVAGKLIPVDVFPKPGAADLQPISDTLPVCVVDLSALRSRRINQIPLSFISMLPPAALFEIKGMEQESPTRRDGAIRKMRSVIGMNPQLFVAKHFNEIVADERQTGRVTALASLVDIEGSKNVRGHTSSETDWAAFADPRFGARSVRRYETLKNHFKQARLTFAELIRSRSVKAFGANPTKETALLTVREYRSIRSFINYVYPDFDEAAWTERLDRFPDEFAMGRLARVSLSYMVLAWAGETREMDNDFEDMEYAFLATYADGLVTRDTRMKAVVSNCSPATKIFKSLDEADTWFRQHRSRRARQES